MIAGSLLKRKIISVAVEGVPRLHAPCESWKSSKQDVEHIIDSLSSINRKRCHHQLAVLKNFQRNVGIRIIFKDKLLNHSGKRIFQKITGKLNETENVLMYDSIFLNFL